MLCKYINLGYKKEIPCFAGNEAKRNEKSQINTYKNLFA